MQNQKMKDGLVARVNNLFTDREFFMRANGQVRFLTVTARLQKRIAIIVGAVIGIWLFITLAMTISQLTVTGERVALAEKEAAVNSEQSEVAAYKASIDSIAKDLIRRQEAMEQITQQFIGENAILDEKTGGQKAPLSKAEKKQSENTRKISAAFPEAAILARLEARQIAFAHRLTRVALARTARAEAAIREFGFNPATFAATPAASNEAVGGPYIPLFTDGEKELHPTLERLNDALLRMDNVERTLLTIPSAMPTGITTISSGFGYRHDPFNGGGAMHSGIDFKGPRGQPILAAARGVITYAGWRSGYGKTVEITHGNGLMTRYAHLSKIQVRTGQEVKRGLQVGAMGSTGRSTGTHLHFEVRLNGAAINPQPFLKENTDVLKVQAIARQRTDSPERTPTAKRTAKKSGSSRG